MEGCRLVKNVTDELYYRGGGPLAKYQTMWCGLAW
jgi:hypothetical protein